jgi:hypothetical protein
MRRGVFHATILQKGLPLPSGGSKLAAL